MADTTDRFSKEVSRDLAPWVKAPESWALYENFTQSYQQIMNGKPSWTDE